MEPKSEVVFQYKHIRFVLKKNYIPPYLWIEKYRPKKCDYEIVAKLTVEEELPGLLRKIAEECESLTL